MAGAGVSVVVIPGDVFEQQAVDSGPARSVIARGTNVRVFPDQGEAAGLVQAINQAGTVTLFCGLVSKVPASRCLLTRGKIKGPHRPCFWWQDAYPI